MPQVHVDRTPLWLTRASGFTELHAIHRNPAFLTAASFGTLGKIRAPARATSMTTSVHRNRLPAGSMSPTKSPPEAANKHANGRHGAQSVATRNAVVEEALQERNTTTESDELASITTTMPTNRGSATQSHAQDCRVIRRSQLRAIVPLSDTTIYEMEQRGEFPRRFYLTPRCVAWSLSEVEAWVAQRRQSTPKNTVLAPPAPDVRLRKTRPVKTPKVR